MKTAFFFLSLSIQIISALLGTAFAVNTCRDDATGIACSFATRKKSLQAKVHQCFRVAEDAHGTAGTGLDTNHDGHVGEESVTLATKSLEPLLQTMADG